MNNKLMKLSSPWVGVMVTEGAVNYDWGERGQMTFYGKYFCGLLNVARKRECSKQSFFDAHS